MTMTGWDEDVNGNELDVRHGAYRPSAAGQTSPKGVADDTATARPMTQPKLYTGSLSILQRINTIKYCF